MAPTAKEVEIKGISILRLSEEGKVVESWDYFDQLRLVRQSIEQELRVARSIQQAALPKEVPTLEGWQLSPYYQPAREVGEISTTSTSSQRVDWPWSWGTLPARGCPQRW